MALAALLVALGSVIATAVGVLFARKAAGAADIANRIENERRHAEMRPRYLATLDVQQGGEQEV